MDRAERNLQVPRESDLRLAWSFVDRRAVNATLSERCGRLQSLLEFSVPLICNLNPPEF